MVNLIKKDFFKYDVYHRMTFNYRKTIRGSQSYALTEILSCVSTHYEVIVHETRTRV